MYLVNFIVLILTCYLDFGSAADLCKNLVWKRMDISGLYLYNYTATAIHPSPEDCIEQCRYIEACKSVGFRPSDNKCFIYDDRVYSGLDAQQSTETLYYWALETECPISSGYNLDPTNTVCTKYYSQTKSWKDALKQCRDDNGHLFTLETQDKKNVMINYTADLGSYTHLGATDINKEDEWNWLSGESINRSDFIPGRPDNSNGNQHCVTYKTEGSGVLDDRICNDVYGFVCEVPFKSTG